MTRRTGDNESFAGDLRDHDVVRGSEHRQQRQVHAAVGDLLHQRRRTVLPQVDIDIGVGGVESAEQAGQVHEGAQALHRADDQQPPLEAQYRGNRLPGFTRASENSAGLFVEGPAGGGHFDPPCAAFEKVCAELRLERSDG